MSIEYCVDIKVTPMKPSAVEWLEKALNMEMLTESIKYTMERNLPCFYIIL